MSVRPIDSAYNTSFNKILVDEPLFDRVIQWGTKGLQCCALLGLLTYISRNKIEQILKIFEKVHRFLSFNLIQRLYNNLFFVERYCHLCQVIILQQFCPWQSEHYKVKALVLGTTS